MSVDKEQRYIKKLLTSGTSDVAITLNVTLTVKRMCQELSDRSWTSEVTPDSVGVCTSSMTSFFILVMMRFFLQTKPRNYGIDARSSHTKQTICE